MMPPSLPVSVAHRARRAERRCARTLWSRPCDFWKRASFFCLPSASSQPARVAHPTGSVARCHFDAPRLRRVAIRSRGPCARCSFSLCSLSRCRVLAVDETLVRNPRWLRTITILRAQTRSRRSKSCPRLRPIPCRRRHRPIPRRHARSLLVVAPFRRSTKSRSHRMSLLRAALWRLRRW